MYHKVAVILIVCCFSILACSKSKEKIEEKKAQALLTSTKMEDRSQGVFMLSKLWSDNFSLSGKTENLVVKTLANEIQMKRMFKEQAKSGGKSLHQIMEEFDQKFPHREYTDYLDSLTSLIVNMGTQKGIPVVFQFLLDGGYVFDDAILVKSGAPAFDFLLEKASEGSDEERELAISILSVWINPPKVSDHIDAESISSLSQKQKQRLQPILLLGFQGTNLEIKYYAIRGLGAFLNQVEISQALLKLIVEGETEAIRKQAKRIMDGF